MVYECGLRLAERSKSGGPSLGRSPDAHKQRRPVNQDQIQIYGKIGSTQFLEQGESPALFSLKRRVFLSRWGLRAAAFFRDACRQSRTPLTHDAANTMAAI